LSHIIREENGLRVSQKRVPLRICGPEGEKITRGWKKLHNEEPITYTPHIIRAIGSRRIGWVGHIAHMVENRYAYKVSVGYGEGKRQFRRPKKDERILKWILKKLYGWVWTGFTWLCVRTNGGLL
jgi:hypothetical protein